MNNFYKINEAIKYIDEHLSDPLSVQQIAEHFRRIPSAVSSAQNLHMRLTVVLPDRDLCFPDNSHSRHDPCAGRDCSSAPESAGLPALSKDRVKELLFDYVGFQSREGKVNLGVASTDSDLC